MGKCLITGCGGFLGSHLADFLCDRGFDVYGLIYGDARNIEHLKDRITILDYWRIEIQQDIKPEVPSPRSSNEL